MKILLLGEYSNVHNTLAQAFRRLGNEVVVVSNGDFWKNYPRDVDVSRDEKPLAGLRLWLRILHRLPEWQGFDIVQLINPMFFELRAERLFFFYRYLRRHNKKVVLAAMGMDYYWVHESRTRLPLRYSDFNFGKELRTDPEATRYVAEWESTTKERLNRFIAADCDHIIAGLYEYWVCYAPAFPAKTSFCALPIVPKKHMAHTFDGCIRAFIGINRERHRYKGTDVMLQAAQRIAHGYPERFSLQVAESVPFAQYVELMQGCDLILDQLYSYTPAMNALEAMSRGLICVGGGEPESYQLLGEEELRPIINVLPSENDVYQKLQRLVLNRDTICALKCDNMAYIAKHHDYLRVATKYLEIYERLLKH